MFRKRADFWNEDERFWCKGKPYSLVMGLVILIVCPMGALLLSSSTTTIHAQVKEKVEVSAPDDALSWEINPKSPGIYTKTLILKVKANTDWQLTVKDTDSASAGYMREWVGERYGAKKLIDRMKVSADKVATLSNIDSLPIKEGTRTGDQGVEVQVTFTQEVTAEDEPLPDGEVYRKVVTFMGSPKE